MTFGSKQEFNERMMMESVVVVVLCVVDCCRGFVLALSDARHPSCVIGLLGGKSLCSVCRIFQSQAVLRNVDSSKISVKDQPKAGTYLHVEVVRRKKKLPRDR